jgi:hypothetical protein
MTNYEWFPGETAPKDGELFMCIYKSILVVAFYDTLNQTMVSAVRETLEPHRNKRHLYEDGLCETFCGNEFSAEAVLCWSPMPSLPEVNNITRKFKEIKG